MPTKRKDGRLQSSVIITDPLTNEKKRVYVYGYTADEVQRELNRVKRDSCDADFRNVKFSEWVQEWLRIKKDDIAASTYTNYKLIIDKDIMPYLKDISLKRITPALIRQMLRNIDGGRMKQYTYVLIKSILEQAYKDDIIDRNPCIAVKAPRYKSKEKDIITPELFKTLLENASEQMRRVFIVAYYTGMRRGEICALRWNDVDFIHKMLDIHSSAKLVDGEYVIGTPKTENSIRKILLSQNVIDVLKAQMLMQKQIYLRHADKVKDDDFIFTSKNSYKDFLSPNTITQAFKDIKRRLKLSNVSFHSFRHTHTTMLVEAGLSIKAIQLRLGHSTPSFTLARYAHGTEKMQEQIVDFLDKHSTKKMSSDIILTS